VVADNGTIDVAGQTKIKTKNLTIPTPPIHIDPNYDTRPYVPYQPPKHYIKFQLNTGAGNITAHERYDLLMEDMLWLKATNEENKMRGLFMSEDDMESVIELFEKEVARHGMIDPTPKFPVGAALHVASSKLHVKGRTMAWLGGLMAWWWAGACL